LDFINSRKTPTKKEKRVCPPLSLMSDSLVKSSRPGNWLINGQLPPRNKVALTGQIDKLQNTRKPDRQQQSPPREPQGSQPHGSGNQGMWVWKNTMPKAGEPTTKDFEGKQQYHVDC
jgi:hypothetical protein